MRVITWFQEKRRRGAERAEHKRNFGHAKTAVPQLQAEVDERAKEFGLDPELPELVRLKQQLSGLYRDMGECYCHHFVTSRVDPEQDYSVSEEGVIIVQERFLGCVLKPWTIAEYHFGDPIALRQRLKRIVVNGSGTHLFDGDGRELICYGAGVCDPHRLMDTGNRLQNAVVIIEHHSGNKFDWRELIGVYSAVFELDDTGLSLADLNTDPATA